MSSGTKGAVQFPVNKNTETAGIFLQKDQPRKEQKKFGYKSRKLAHPLRHADEQEALIKMEFTQEEDKKKFNKNNKDFILRNKERFKPKDQVHNSPPGSTHIKPGTVTLTQEQLAALLASLGKIADKDSPMKISIDPSNNRIEVDNYNTDSGEDEDVNDPGNSKYRKTGDNDKGNSKEKASKTVSGGKQKSQAELSLNTLNTAQTLQLQLSGKEMRQENGVGNVPNMVPLKHMTVGERKRLQWAREREDLDDDYDPWGKPGAGAPMHKKEFETRAHNSGESVGNNISLQKMSTLDADRKQKQELIASEIERLEKEIRETENKRLEEENKIQRALKESRNNEREEHLSKTKDDRKKKTTKVVEVQVKADNKTQGSQQGNDQVRFVIVKRKKEMNKVKTEKGEEVSFDKQDEVSKSKRHQKESKKDFNKADHGNIVKDKQADDGKMLKTEVASHVPVTPAGISNSRVISNNMGFDSAASLNKKEMERKKWLADLDKQRQEQRLKKQQEKERDLEGIHDQFVDRFVSHKTGEHVSPRHEQYSTHVVSHKITDEGPVLGSLPEKGIETYVPHTAMRSAMVVGTGTLDETRYDNAKSEEKRRWREDLDRQREEQRMAKLAQKEKDREDAGIWADHYPVDRQKLNQTNEILQYQYVSPRTSNSVNTQRTSSAPNVTTQDSDKEKATPPSFLRGQGAFIDPVTRREQEEKRRMHLEYQAQVKAQIEEKERKKREDRERKMLEDMEEERKLQMERDSLNRQLEVELRKNKEREELRQKQMNVLKSALDDAQEKALEDKNVKRIHHLQKRGHDVSQLRAAYEVNAPLLKEYDISSVNERGMVSSREYQTYKTVPALTSTYNIDTDLLRHEPQGELGYSRAQYKKDPYIEDRVLTPSTYRNPSMPRDIPDSPRREFGTQTLDLKDLKAILQNLPDEVQIEYKMKLEEALQEKERGKQAPKRKVHAKQAEDNRQDTHLNVKEAQNKEKSSVLENKPLWNQRRRKTVVKNSEKDPFYLQKKEEAEQRRERREKQLLYLQELNKEKIPSHARSPGKSHGESPEEKRQIEEKGRKVAPASKTLGENPRTDNANILSLVNGDEKKQMSKSPQNTGSSSPPIPAIRHRATGRNENDPYQFANNYLQLKQVDSKYGDAAVVPTGDEFVPFMRTTEILDPSKADEPVAISRENSRAERARNSYYDTHNPANKGKKLDVYRDKERESTHKAQNPLFHPGLVSDHPTARQEMILQQLSSLKQTLKQRQKELEDYMTPGELQEGAVRG